MHMQLLKPILGHFLRNRAYKYKVLYILIVGDLVAYV